MTYPPGPWEVKILFGSGEYAVYDKYGSKLSNEVTTILLQAGLNLLHETTKDE